jgi:5'-methylthioadenosine phosphorylase
MSEPIALAVIGGSGLYDLNDLQNKRKVDAATPYGPTSAPILVGDLDGCTVAFLARHGIGHWLRPTDVPYRANVFALKSLGVERIVSVSACGSLREALVPGHIVIPDQLFDYTKDRSRSFFSDGIVAHVSIPEPFCPQLSDQLTEASRAAGATTHRGGTFITIEGPRFSTKAESHLFRSWGMSLIGMTTAPEAFLAREAEICYAVMAHVTDYDVWHESAAPVTVETVVQILARNTALAQQTIRQLLRILKPDRDCGCPNALSGAIITKPEAIPRQTLLKLAPLVSKYIPI